MPEGGRCRFDSCKRTIKTTLPNQMVCTDSDKSIAYGRIGFVLVNDTAVYGFLQFMLLSY